MGLRTHPREGGVNADPKIIAPAPDAEHPEKSNHDGSAEPERSSANALRIWMTRIRALLFVTLCATFGVLLLILPWTPKWTDNPLLLSFPTLRDFVSSGFVRGIASGLGILDLWLGFWEAIHYHEPAESSD
jgi:hypothetical protein